ncbi:hypothetical protein ACFPM0_18530 [Pseudonocardia sulfidoxydans]|uniref:hypothetical protein n=1 Tax=Pseudonocardia sulfidoxydans TaxID=54011 RepID=UPI0036070277
MTNRRQPDHVRVHLRTHPRDICHLAAEPATVAGSGSRTDHEGDGPAPNRPAEGLPNPP